MVMEIEIDLDEKEEPYQAYFYASECGCTHTPAQHTFKGCSECDCKAAWED